MEEDLENVEETERHERMRASDGESEQETMADNAHTSDMESEDQKKKKTRGEEILK